MTSPPSESTTPRQPGQALVLADIPERNHLRQLQKDLDAARDAIAELDLELTSLRQTLYDFERVYTSRLAEEHHQLRRIERLVQHMERVVALLAREWRGDESPRKLAKLDARRARELETQAAEIEARRKTSKAVEKAAEKTAPAGVVAEKSDAEAELKRAYRSLARRFHPDLATSEEERVYFGQVMARINELYRHKQLERLLELVEQAKGGEIDDAGLGLDEQISLLEERLAWFRTVLENLYDERAALERSATCQLLRDYDQARALGRDLIEELRAELAERIARSYYEVQKGAHYLESCVTKFNQRAALVRRGKSALETFDPYADKRLIRLGLDELETLRISPAAERYAAWVSDLAGDNPAMLRALLLTYVSELSPFPLTGLESYDEVRQRFEALGQEDEPPVTLEQILVEADELIEYGIKKATPQVAYSGLKFRSAAAREAMPAALKNLSIRREFRRVLSVLGEREVCPHCDVDMFSVPLFRIRGLDDLRAIVCSECGETLRSYWMPKGKDVQAVLGAAFLDFELVVEFSFRLGHASLATQVLPLALEAMTVGDLKKRFCHDVLARNEIEVSPAEVQLWLAPDEGEELLTRPSERTTLEALESRAFVVRFAGAEISESDALEMVRHRIRTRFKG